MYSSQCLHLAIWIYLKAVPSKSYIHYYNTKIPYCVYDVFLVCQLIPRVNLV